jgi:eukaryotic-like serine/threonine-protein kinase
MSFEVGSTVGDYQIVQVLGAGGMGKVYKVRNVLSDRIEAIKVLLPNLTSDPEGAERFMREIKVQAALDHPNIAALHTAHRVDNQLLMVMEFVEGKSIEAVLKSTKVPVREGVDYICQVLSALAYAHSHGVVHRDIKPANMMVTTTGVVKLMDFGIAKIAADRNITQAGRTVGSLYYMSPEQIQGSTDLGPRSDLYSTGVSLYEIVTGARPFQGDSDFSIMAAHLQQAPLAPIQYDVNLPASLNEVILMSIAKEPERRFQSADAFRNALLNVMKDLPAHSAEESATRVIQAALPRDFTPTRVSAPVVIPPTPAGRPVTSPMPVAAAPPSPAAAPVVYPVAPAPPPMAAPPPPAPATSSRRGLYMVVGSVATLAVLVLAITQVPKFFRTSASGGANVPPITQSAPPAKASTPQPTPAQVSAPTPVQPAPSQTAATPGAAQATAPSPAPAGIQQRPVRDAIGSRIERRVEARQEAASQTGQHAPQPAAAATPPPAAPPQPAGPDPAVVKELDSLRERQGLMAVRMETVAGSLRRLSAQQASSGYGPSPELTGAAGRMRLFNDQAVSALRNGDPAGAKKALDSAERELEKLEDKFGR